jgi:hypothetical protein
MLGKMDAEPGSAGVPKRRMQSLCVSMAKDLVSVTGTQLLKSVHTCARHSLTQLRTTSRRKPDPGRGGIQMHP